MKFNPYSVSKLGTYNQCPLKFKLNYIEKIRVPFTYNVALYKGSYIHEILEHNYDYDTPFKTNEIFTEQEKEKSKSIVKTFENSDLGIKYKKIALSDEFKSVHEEKFGYKIVNSKLEICDYWDKECWIRGAIDFQYIDGDKVYNIDWKSGKSHATEKDFGITQSTAYSIFLFLKYPEIDTVVSNFVFVEHSNEKEIIYTRDKFNEYVKYFYDMTKTVEIDEIYKEDVGALCDWCDFYKHGYCNKPKEKAEITDTFMNSKITF